ncbi:Helicase, C-terminal [Dillenia turbinata]|uniref:ATP-dependent RNA helicase n=1 Tax=Dillenia turbinata TaxID=194707 RepID=A0AAN8WFA6_9MAGN
MMLNSRASLSDAEITEESSDKTLFVEFGLNFFCPLVFLLHAFDNLFSPPQEANVMKDNVICIDKVLEKLYRARWVPEDGVHHAFSAGLLIGGRRDVDTEQQHLNELNILICTPGCSLQHIDETANFESSQLQILVLVEAVGIFDVGFKKPLLNGFVFVVFNLSNIHEIALRNSNQVSSWKNEAGGWGFIDNCEQRSVLFSTDVASRGLDFNKAAERVDCPEDVAGYVHRVGHTALLSIWREISSTPDAFRNRDA